MVRDNAMLVIGMAFAAFCIIIGGVIWWPLIEYAYKWWTS